MDTETKQEFENLANIIGDKFTKVDEKFEKKFEELAIMIGGSFAKVDEQFDDIRSKMATKEGLAKVESRLDAKIDSVESRLDAKIDSVKSSLGAKIDGVEGSLSEKITDLKETVEKLDARDKEDTPPATPAAKRWRAGDALASDVLNLQQRVGVLKTKP